MHEYSLVNSVINSIIDKTKEFKNIKKIKLIKLTLGSLKMVSKEQFIEIFKQLSLGTICEDAKIEIQETNTDILRVDSIEAEFMEN